MKLAWVKRIQEAPSWIRLTYFFPFFSSIFHGTIAYSFQVKYEKITLSNKMSQGLKLPGVIPDM